MRPSYYLDFIKWNIENPPRQSLPKVYQPTGAIYIVKRNFLIKKNSLKGKKNVPFVVSNDEFVNIDDIKDVKIFKMRLKN